MGYGLSDEQVMFRDSVRRLASERVAPRAAEIDRTGEFPWDMVQLLADNGLIGVGVPEAYGGGGADLLSTALAIEELARVCATTSLVVAAQHLGAMPIIIAGTEAQKQRFLPPVARGEKLAAFALTEPDAGSDAAGAKTRAVRAGSGWTLSGSKVFITNGGLAETIVVFAATDLPDGQRGMSAFVVDSDMKGVKTGRIEDKMGIRGSQTAELIFDGVELPDDRLLAQVGDGFKIAMRTLDRTRLGIAAQALGIAEGAFRQAAAHVSQRRQFGRTLNQFQGLQWMLSDMATEVEASRQLLYRACDVIEQAGFAIESSPEVTRYSAMAKLKCSDTAMQVTTDAVQLFGGYGYIKDYPVERMMRDAKITQIYEGTNQVQRIVIFRNLEDSI